MTENKIYTINELRDKLTEKERIFCHQYIIDWNATRAAKTAKYSEKSAKEIGSQNLTKLHIKQYIDFIKGDIEKESGVTKLKQINELAKIAYSSIANLHDTWIELSEFQKLTEDQRAAIESIDTKVIKKNLGTKDEPDIYDVEYVKIKLFSKIGAISEINKMMGYNAPEKKELSIDVDDISNMSTEELKERAEALNKINESQD